MMTRLGAVYSRKLLLAVGTLVFWLLLLAGGTQYALADVNGAAYAKFDSGTGTLTFFRSEDVYTTLQKETYLDGEDNEQTITYYAGIETTDWPASTSGAPRWVNEYRTLTRIVFEDEIAPISTNVWFYGLSNLASIEGIQKLDTSNVTSMWYMFGHCQKLSELDVSHMNVSNVKHFGSMFSNCKGLTELDVSGFDTSQAEDMSEMFSGCTGLTSLDVSGFDTSHVKDMAFMFSSCMSLTGLNLSNFNTSCVERLWGMFYGCEMLASLDVSHFDTSHVTDMRRTFQFCFGLTELNLSEWDTSNVTSMEYMFDGCSHLTSLDVSGFDTSNVESMKGMFYSCSRLTALDVSSLETPKVTDMSYMFSACAGLTSLDVSDLDTSQVKSFQEMFSYCRGLTEIDFTGLDTSQVENMSSMFEKCENLVSVNLTGLNTSNVTGFYAMFSGCSSLSNLAFSGLVTSSATFLRNMFKGCSGLTSLNLSTFDTSSVTVMDHMFDGCSSLTSLNMTGWDTSNVTTMEGMFQSCASLSTLDVTGFNTSNVTSMARMFYGCEGLSALDVSHFKTSRVTNMGGMFDECNLTSLDVTGFDTSRVTNMSYMFLNCDKLTELDLSSFDTSLVEDMYGLFGGCSGLKALKLGEKTKLGSSLNLPGSKWQLARLNPAPVRYQSLDGFDGSNPGWYLQGYFELTIEGVSDAVYTGDPIEPTPTVSTGERVLAAGTDYTVSYADNTNAGTATVTVAGAGRWTGSTEIAFTIAAKSIEPMLTLSAVTLTYNGADQDPGITVKDGTDVLSAGKDYDVAYPDGHKDVGTHTVEVTCKGNYSGTTSEEFSIVAKAIEPTVILSPAELTYNGSAQVPEITVKDGEDVLAASTDYDVTLPQGRTDVGEYAVEVTLKGNYSGTGDAAFAIVPQEAEFSLTLSPEEFTYNGRVQVPEVIVKDSEGVVVSDYDMAFPNGCKDVGTYTVTVARTGNYSGTASATFKIAKASNTLTVTGKAAKLKASKLKKKARRLALNKAMTVKVGAANSKLAYKLTRAKKGKKSFKKSFKVNAKTGVITVKKGLKKGTYRITVKVNAAATKNYNAATRTATVTLRVK